MDSSLHTIKKGKLLQNVSINGNLNLPADTFVKFQLIAGDSEHVNLVFYFKIFPEQNFGTYMMIWPNKTVLKTSVQEVPPSPPPPPPPPSPDRANGPLPLRL